MKMKIYVGATWEERQTAKWTMGELEKRGHVITHDWTNHEAPNTGDPIGDEIMWEKYAEEDLNGVNEADILVVINPNGVVSTGKMIELGYAIAKGKKIYVCGKHISFPFRTQIEPIRTPDQLFERIAAYSGKVPSCSECGSTYKLDGKNLCAACRFAMGKGE